MTKQVITVSWQWGSGGHDISRRLAERLGVSYMDREIISRAAALAGASEETIQEAERVPSFLTRMVELLGRYPVAAELVGPAGDLPMAPALSTESYRLLIEDVIRGVAEQGNAVIAGHGGQMALRHDRSVLKVYICAPLHLRVARLMEAENLIRTAAEKQIKEHDRQRMDFFQNYYKVRWDDPLLYDLVLNVDKINADVACDLILVALARVGT